MDILKIKGKRIHLTRLRTQDQYGNGPISVHCGVYKKNKYDHETWTGESIDGQIPLEELIKWGFRKGYLNFIGTGDRI